MDPKLGFWVDSKSHSKEGFWQIFHTLGLKLGFLNSAKYHTLIKDMGSKSYPNPVFIAGKKHTLISYFYKPEKTYLFFLIFAVFDTLNTTRVVRSSPWETTPFPCFCTQAWYPPLNTSGPPGIYILIHGQLNWKGDIGFEMYLSIFQLLKDGHCFLNAKYNTFIKYTIDV